MPCGQGNESHVGVSWLAEKSEKLVNQIRTEGLTKEEALAKEMAAQLEAEKERRIEQLAGQGLRRIAPAQRCNIEQGLHLRCQ